MYKTEGESRGVTTASRLITKTSNIVQRATAKRKSIYCRKDNNLNNRPAKWTKEGEHTDPQRGVASENLPSTETNIRTKAHRNKAAETGRLDPSEKKRKRNNTTILLIWRSHCTNCCCCNRGWRDRYFLFPLTCFHQPITVHLRR